MTDTSLPKLAEFLKANPELQNHSSGVVLEPEPALTKPVPIDTNQK